MTEIYHKLILLDMNSLTQRRIASLDYWRALAILFVVEWHFFPIPVEFGRIGVEIFFVLSGFLVSRPLIQASIRHQSMPWKNFAIARFWRIVPSYYLYLGFGTLVCFLAFLNPEGDRLVPPSDTWLSFLFLYKNYNQVSPRAFGHIWSLCVEEHFYILLPALFAAFGRWGPSKMLCAVGLLFVAELFIRYLGYTQYIETHFNLYFSDPAATHNNFDGLMLGVLMRFFYELRISINSLLIRSFIFLLGLTSICISNGFAFDHQMFHYVVTMKSIDSIAIAIMMWATLDFNFDQWKTTAIIGTFLKQIARVSYNWYLWHMIALLIVEVYWGRTILSFVLYIASGFLISLIFTKIIETIVDRKVAAWPSRLTS